MSADTNLEKRCRSLSGRITQCVTFPFRHRSVSVPSPVRLRSVTGPSPFRHRSVSVPSELSVFTLSVVFIRLAEDRRPAIISIKYAAHCQGIHFPLFVIIRISLIIRW